MIRVDFEFIAQYLVFTGPSALEFSWNVVKHNIHLGASRWQGVEDLLYVFSTAGIDR